MKCVQRRYKAIHLTLDLDPQTMGYFEISDSHIYRNNM